MPFYNLEIVWRRRLGRLAGVVAISALVAQRAGAQTDYYNTDAGRPVRIEDAASIERYAFELQVAPARLARESGGTYQVESALGVGYGVLPRTQLELEVPLTTMEAPDGSRMGIPGVGLGVLHNLNAETTTLPAFAIAAHALLPVGEFAPDATFPSVSVLMTRTLPMIRVHVNAEYTLGDAADAGGNRELSRWLGGIAIDRALPLRSVLVMAEVFAEQPLDSGSELAWTVGTGVRAQHTPRVTIDIGAGRRLTGDAPEWYATAGAAFMFSIRALMPGGTDDH